MTRDEKRRQKKREELIERVCENIKAEREAQELSLEELGRRMGYNPGTAKSMAYQIETMYRRMSIGLIGDVAQALEIEPSDLLREDRGK